MDVAFVPFAALTQPTTAKKPPLTKKQEIAMTQANKPDTQLYWLIGIVAVFFLIVLIFGLVSFFIDFSKELKYINCEIQRTLGSEQRYWIRKRHKLWLSLIPFMKY